MSDLQKMIERMPAEVRRWVMRGGAVPDAVWFGNWVHLRQRNPDGITWSRTELCEQLKNRLLWAGDA